jgi:PHP family Zn ribbon phosphoesterase
MWPSLSKEKQKTEKNKVFYTIEFYPEEGKYHYSGHRNCNVTMTPEEQRESKGICPVCKRHVTDGVMRRVQELAQEDPRSTSKNNKLGLKWYTDPKGIHPPYVKLVPLNEIIAEAIGSPVGSPKVKVIFDELCKKLDSEINILLKVPIEDIEKVVQEQNPSTSSGLKVAEGVEKVRTANIVIKPGYDGVYGVVKIWHEEKDELKDEEKSEKSKEDKKSQLGLEL